MIISEENVGKRIDKYLSENLDYSRTIIQKMIDNENIKVNDKKTKASYKLELNDTVLIDDSFKEETDILPENIKLDIVYEDNDLMIINKPSGMVVHPGNGNQEHTLVNALMGYTTNLSDGSKTRPGIVHRLDKDTSGLMVVAKDDKTHELLADMIKHKKVERKYVALVWGVIKHEKGTINAPIGRDFSNRQKYTVTDVNSKESITHFKVLKRFKDATLVECILETGRTHQIRVHFTYINHPIVNDPLYGNRKIINDFGQMLHSKSIKFIHPITKEKLYYEVDVPEEFKAILKEFEE